jgi:hypothetical protein
MTDASHHSAVERAVAAYGSAYQPNADHREALDAALLAYLDRLVKMAGDECCARERGFQTAGGAAVWLKRLRAAYLNDGSGSPALSPSPSEGK